MENNTDKKEDPIVEGSVVQGTVTHITHFGAFVKLYNGKEGLVHISEIANEYVKSITDYVNLEETIDVKVIRINKEGKLELSIKQLLEKKEDTDNNRGLFIQKKSKDVEFENKLTDYLKRSEEKQIDIRRNLKKKHGIKKNKR